MQIALLEDGTHQADVMQVWLQAAGHGCQAFQTGKAFLEAVSRKRYDLFILDWVLPDTNGIQVLQDVRATCDRTIPALFVAPMDKEEDVILALETNSIWPYFCSATSVDCCRADKSWNRSGQPAPISIPGPSIPNVSRIRNKLGLHPENGWKLSAIYQHGYRLERLAQSANQIGEA